MDGWVSAGMMTRLMMDRMEEWISMCMDGLVNGLGR